MMNYEYGYGYIKISHLSPVIESCCWSSPASTSHIQQLSRLADQTQPDIRTSGFMTAVGHNFIYRLNHNQRLGKLKFTEVIDIHSICIIISIS